MLIRNIALAIIVALFTVVPLHSADQSIDIDKNPRKVEYVVFTEDYPPYSFRENGEIKGSSTEIIKTIFKRLKIENYRILLLDWDLSYDFVQYIPNSIIYSLTKTKERENKFKWAGPVATNYWYLFADSNNEKTRNVEIGRLNDCNKYKIAVQKQGSIASYLKNNGINNLLETTTTLQSLQDLLDNKAELLAVSESVAYSLMKKLDKPKSILHKVYTLRKRQLYIGFNSKISDSLVKQFQDTLDSMKKDGTYDKIINKHYDQIYN
ncbi:MAG TPA: ABC transporter substrate-binding protein [Victivallales bacterium]|nr:ABC transporter substrate-binding protein [Victivallales bacterium]